MAKHLKIEKGQFIRSLGYALTKSGNVRPRTWYLGAATDGEAAALEKAATIKQVWDAGAQSREVQSNGQQVRVWNDDADPLAGNGPAAPSAPPPQEATPASTSPLTVGEAKQLYLDHLKSRWQNKQVSQAYYNAICFNLDRPAKALGEDKPLASIGARQIEEAVMVIAARPEAEQHGKKLGRSIAKITAENYLKALRVWLEWISHTEQPGTDEPLFRLPMRWKEIFRRNSPQFSPEEMAMMVAAENGDAPDIFTIDELATLFRRAGDRQQCWMLLSLNCGFANAELASLLVSECRLGDKPPKIARLRRKTLKRGDPRKSYAEWVLWDETITMLRHYIQADKRQASVPALLTEEGLTLVAPRGVSRRDAVRSAWVNIVDILPENRQLPYKHLRKTGAQLIRNMAGDDVADMYLSHSDGRRMLGHYSGRDWSRLAEALRRLREKLAPLFAGWERKIRRVPMGSGKNKYSMLVQTLGAQ